VPHGPHGVKDDGHTGVGLQRYPTPPMLGPRERGGGARTASWKPRMAAQHAGSSGACRSMSACCCAGVRGTAMKAANCCTSACRGGQ